MKGKKCFGLLLALSIIFGLSLSVFSDVNAVELTVPVKLSNIWKVNWRCRNKTTEEYNCTVSSGPANIGWIQTDRTINLKKGHYYQIYIRVLTTSAQAKPITNFWRLANLNDNFRYIDYEQVTDDRLPQEWVNADLDNLSGGPYSEFTSTSYRLTYYAEADINDFYVKIGNYDVTLFIIPDLTANIIFDVSPVFEYEVDNPAEEMNEKDDEDRSNIESQQSDSQSGADESQEDAESTGTTLLGAFTGFVSALTSATPSNCNIDMDLGNLDLGVVNLCQLSLPQPFPTIASIMLILFCVPLSIATARKVINLFRSFQG